MPAGAHVEEEAMDMTVSGTPFSMVPLPEARAGKPRRSGLTMMMDWGLPCGRLDRRHRTGVEFDRSHPSPWPAAC